MPADTSPGVAVTSVKPHSASWMLGIRPGDRLTHVGMRAVEDALAVTFALATGDEGVALRILRGVDTAEIFLSETDEFLHEVTLEPLQTRSCANDCLYCFCKQNPPTARQSLSFRDEDFRLSFLNGSYLTLSALTDDALHRIIHDRLHPLYITVPSTDERLRARMLGVRTARPLLPTLRELASADIVMHAQVVVCPGLNDGVALDRTLSDLAALRPGLASVALVPVGTTRYTPDPRIRRPSLPELRHLLTQAARWRSSPRGEPAWVHAADEAYIAAGRPLPSWGEYGEAPQLASGVGMARRFVDDAGRVVRRRMPRWWPSHRIAFITGTLFAPVLGRIVEALNRRWGRRAQLVPVENQFFGSSVTVAGLLGGGEIAECGREMDVDAVIVSDDALDPGGTRFIDDVERATVESAVRAPLIMAGLLSEAMRAAHLILGPA